MSIALSYDDTLSRVRVSGVMPGFRDTFTRTVSNGWGSSDSGSAWTLAGGAAGDYAVGSGVGTLSLGSVNVTRQQSHAVSAVDHDLQATFKTAALAATQDIICEVAVRAIDANNEYYARLAFGAGATITLLLRKRVAGVVSTLGTYVTGLTHVAANSYKLRIAVTGTHLKAKAWLASGGEPEEWQLDAVDSDLSAAGVGRVRAVLATGNTNSLPLVVTVDDVVGRGTGVVERSTDQIRWTTVRGGAELDGTVGAAYQVDDYEFTGSVVNYYRIRRVASSDQDSITPAMDSVWIKNLARPFLNRAVTVVDWSDVTHESRNAVLPIIGRRDPIGQSDVRLAKRWELTLTVPTIADADELVATFASGEPVFVHTPGPDCPVPGGYAVVGDVSVARGGNSRAPRRFITLPLTGVAAPGPDVIGATMTWQTVINTYATWADVIAANATWQDLLDGIADPGDVVVG